MDESEYGSVTATGNFVIDGLLWGTKWNDSTLSYRFVDTDVIAPGSYAAWTDYEISRIEAALATWAAVANITFGRADATTDTDLTFHLGLADGFIEEGEGDGTTLLGAAIPPNTIDEGTDVSGALWLQHEDTSWSRNASSSEIEAGGYGYLTIVHEVGHALGMAHPHDDGGISGIYPGVVSDTDPGIGGFNYDVYTAMSYVNGIPPQTIETHPLGFGWVASPMAFDIAAIQHIYGANMSHATGDDVYEIPDENGPGTSVQSIWDAGGSDAIVYNGSRNAVIDLRAATLDPNDGALLAGGGLSIAQEIFGGLTVANGVVIETAIGGFGNDTIFGNSAGNVIDARAGDDLIAASTGLDTISGGDGFDIVFVEQARSNVTGTLDGAEIIIAWEAATSRLGEVEFVNFQDASTVLAASAAEATVARMYQTVFDRDADAGGYHHWLDVLDGGTAVIDIASYFLDSLEAAMLAAQDMPDFIASLYRSTFEREANEDEQQIWLDAVDEAGLSRSDLAIYFANSTEAEAKLADSVVTIPEIA